MEADGAGDAVDDSEVVGSGYSFELCVWTVLSLDCVVYVVKMLF